MAFVGQIPLLNCCHSVEVNNVIDIICAAIAGVCSIVVAIIGYSVKKSHEEAVARAEKEEHRAQLRQRESRLSLKMMDATLQLSVVTSNALTGGHNNGNVERARKAAQKAADEYEDFMRELTAHEIGK